MSSERKNNSFNLYLLSQGISSLGDSFQFIAVTTLLVKITGSGLFAGFSIISSTIVSMLILPITGAIGDRFPEKYFLISIDLLRGLLVLLFISNYSVFYIYALLLTLSALDTLYNPPRRKLISNLLERDCLIKGNSQLAGTSGLVYMLGPVMAGIAIGYWGFDIAFFINSTSFFISVLIVLILKPIRKSITKVRFNSGIKDALRYFNESPFIKEIVFIATVIFFGTALTNITFYRFVFDEMKVTSQEWGFMMSLFYGTNLIAMLFSVPLSKKAGKPLTSTVYLSLVLVSVTWIFYGITTSLPVVFLLQVIEGSALCFFGIIMISRLQYVTKRSFMARIIGINDIINNFGKLLGAGLAMLFLNFLNYKVVFILSGIFLLLFSIYKMFTSKIKVKNS